MAVVRAVALILSSCFFAASAGVAKANPLGKVLELLSSLEVKIAKEGDKEAAAFEEFFQWCDTAAKNLKQEIKLYSNTREKQEAKIVEYASNIEVAESKIEDLSSAIAKSEAELKAAASFRAQAAADFTTSEKTLVQATSTLGRALSTITAEMAKNPAALAQVDRTSLASLTQSLSLVVDAAGVSSDDKQKLVALVQSSEGDEELEASPTPAAYKSQSAGIVDVLDELNNKAEAALADARKTEANAKHSFAMMKQALESQIAADTKDLNEEKAAKAEAVNNKAKMEGDLAITVPDLRNDKASLETFNADCMQSAADHEATMAARKEEQKVISQAKKILRQATYGALESTATSLVQLASTSRADLANSEVVSMVKKLARDQHSAALTQLASRIAIVAKYGARDGADPFEKIKGLISAMIEKLEKQGESEATEKAFCNQQIAETQVKKGEFDFDIEKLMSKIDQAVARSAELKDESKVLHEEVAQISKSVSELSHLRSAAHANYLSAKEEIQQGFNAVQKALELLRNYYGTDGEAASLMQEATNSGDSLEQPAKPEQHAKAGGAGASIIGILEVVESDFANGLSKEESEEADAEVQHEAILNEKGKSKIAKVAELRYKTQEIASLEKTISEFTSDKENVDTQLAAVLQYYARVKQRCIASPDAYETRKARREAEHRGLNEALSITESEAAFVQKKTQRMRGGFVAMQ